MFSFYFLLKSRDTKQKKNKRHNLNRLRKSRIRLIKANYWLTIIFKNACEFNAFLYS